MSKKNSYSSIKVNSIIGVNTVLEGTFTTKDITRIDGVVKGNVISEGTLIIGEEGKVEGNIHAVVILIAGEVHGDLFATQKIEASEKGKIFGDIKTKSLIVDESAVFQGNCIMNVDMEKEVEQEHKNEEE